jgi:YidC/Oxa1 family membrane protein insertase
VSKIATTIKKMNPDNKNAMIGMGLIMLILLGWNFMSMPSKQQLEEKQRVQDSTAQATRIADSLSLVKQQVTQTVSIPDSVKMQQMQGEIGQFAAFGVGTEQNYCLENSEMKICFSNKGGRIKDVVLKKHFKLTEDEKHVEQKEALKLFEDVKNKFEWTIPANTPKGSISTQDLYFTPSVSSNTVIFSAKVNDQTYIEQKYVIGGGYDLDYDVQIKGFGQILKPDTKNVQLYVENYLDKLEQNVSYESSYSYLNFRENEQAPDYLSGTGTDQKTLNNVQWVAHSNQFFSTVIMSKNGNFSTAALESQAFDPAASRDLKKTVSRLDLPVQNGDVSANLKLYIGPKDYKGLQTYKTKLEDIVSYGGSILGTINRWIIRPIFDFLHSMIGNVAICILLLTLIVKGILYPLSYKMLKSQAKTTALKPEIEKMKAKFKDDPQKVQMEQMKLYGEYGVNPLGGCLPTLLQMPIWMALFQFFPASIDFRQKGFLWATDLTGFEQFIKLPFHIPLYGAHISLFALLWGISLVVFTWYSMKDVDMSGQPAIMKQMQYFTPIIFTVMFNSYAAGLSLYMLFSNILNIGQTIVTKNYIIDNEAVRAELMENKKKPKKQSAFRQKLDEAMKQQQALKEQDAKKKK